MPASAFDIRETLDEAVRHLAVNAGSIQERVRASGMVILDRLSPTDFASSEDRELLNQILTALGDGPRSDTGTDPPNALAGQMPDTTAEEIASNILDLRDTAMGRAIRNTRVRTQPMHRGGSRR
jgi:hypothetical protein